MAAAADEHRGRPLNGRSVVGSRGAGGRSLGLPSDRSAVIVRATLPAALERLRRRSVGDAADGVPAHLTMLYPFVAPARLSGAVREVVASVASSHPAFDYTLARQGTWPDTIYVEVDPLAPFIALQAALGAAFPSFPIYGADRRFEFVPHVTIAEGETIRDPGTTGDHGWAGLPRSARASALEVIARSDDGRWRTVWRAPLGRSARR